MEPGMQGNWDVGHGGFRLTLLNAVLLGTARVLLAGDTLNALFVVVLGRGALLGFLARCCLESFVSQQSLLSCILES